MSLNDKNHLEYAQRVGPLLDQFVNQQRDLPVEAVLVEGFFLASFVMEDFKAKATKNAELFDKLGIQLITMQDALRMLHVAVAGLSTVTVATLTRVVLEQRAKLKFIFTREDPALYADRFERFGQVERLIHDSTKEDGAKMISPAELERIGKLCPEWIVTKENKKKRRPVVNGFWSNWTADERYTSIRAVAEAAGMLDEYETTYAMTSKFVHGSSLLENLYRGPQGNIGPVGQPVHCKRMAFLAVKNALDAVKEAAQFFGVPWNDDHCAEWKYRLLEAYGMNKSAA